MMFPKDNPWRNKKYTDAAAGQACVRCGVNNDTVVACHYAGLRQHSYGKGRGMKPDDIVTADLCYECHLYVDNPIERKSIERSEEFLHCIAMTLRRRIADGVLKT